ncbi:MAG: carbon storage regulator CsrA [Acidimicrobiia bacterium]|nr:carbon storage regulator CsrA [Acidimicrobiia bacterium]
MLVLTRRANQSIIIGDDVVVTVLEVRGDQVRIGITAPRNVTVHREEVYKQLHDSNVEAAAPDNISHEINASKSSMSEREDTKI